MEILGRVHSIETFGTVDGPGIRYVVFLQGCSLRCKYCHNRDTWSMQSGKEYSAMEIIEDLKKYLPFIQSSKGGLTVSGGEPTCQPSFLLELLKLAKAEGIHTALDTSGFVDLKQIDPILDYVDLVLLDIKHIDPASYAQITGAKLAKTLILAEHLSMRNIPIWIRYVLVPGLTDDPQDVENLAHYISFMKNVEKVEVLPYHELGVGKWEELGYNYPLAGFRSATQEDVKKAVDIFQQYGINTSIKAA